MEQIEIICPHCGVSQEVKEKVQKAFCTFCGSSLSEVLKNLQKQKQNPIPTPTASNASKESNIPFMNQQGIPALPRNLHEPNTHGRGQQKSNAVPFSQPVEQTTFPHQQPSSATLKFLQIHREVKIPYIPAIFHFGRNVILPLVSPQKFDVEWLNSISRVRKQNNKVIHQHFTIIRSSNGKYYIEDNKSRWGTWVNRNQIKGKGRVSLKNGDKIELMLSKPNVKQVFPFVITFEC